MTKTSQQEFILKGINASPGICIGKAYLVDREGVDVVTRYEIEDHKLKNEVKRFKSAVQRAKADLRAVIENSPEEVQNAQILETQIVLLKDKLLYGRTIETIEKERVNAEWALKTVVVRIKAIFQSMPDEYLKERVSDIVHVSDQVMRNLIGAPAVNISQIDKRVILVARDLSPADTSQIKLERIKGFVTDRGGKTSHTGIIAQTLELPAVVGLEQATRLIRNDDLLIVDGTGGTVVVHPEEQTLLAYEERQASYERYKAVITRESHLKAETIDGAPLRGDGQHRAARGGVLGPQLRRGRDRPVPHRVPVPGPPGVPVGKRALRTLQGRRGGDGAPAGDHPHPRHQRRQGPGRAPRHRRGQPGPGSARHPLLPEATRGLQDPAAGHPAGRRLRQRAAAVPHDLRLF